MNITNTVRQGKMIMLSGLILSIFVSLGFSAADARILSFVAKRQKRRWRARGGAREARWGLKYRKRPTNANAG